MVCGSSLMVRSINSFSSFADLTISIDWSGSFELLRDDPSSFYNENILRTHNEVSQQYEKSMTNKFCLF